MDDRDTASPLRATPARPLLGLTILLVEDSVYACDAMRLLSLRSGARLRRADCLKSARRHLQVYRPSVMIVDLGLPDGSGADLIAEVAATVPRVAALLATSGDPFARDIAIAAGADDFIEKPVSSLAAFQSFVLSNLPRDMRPFGLRPVVDQTIEPDRASYHDDLHHVRGMLVPGLPPRMASYVAQLVGGVARSVRDDGIAFAADALADAGTEDGLDEAATLLARLIDDRLENRIAI